MRLSRGWRQYWFIAFVWSIIISLPLLSIKEVKNNTIIKEGEISTIYFWSWLPGKLKISVVFETPPAVPRVTWGSETPAELDPPPPGKRQRLPGAPFDLKISVNGAEPILFRSESLDYGRQSRVSFEEEIMEKQVFLTLGFNSLRYELYQIDRRLNGAIAEISIKPAILNARMSLLDEMFLPFIIFAFGIFVLFVYFLFWYIFS